LNGVKLTLKVTGGLRPVCEVFVWIKAKLFPVKQRTQALVIRHILNTPSSRILFARLIYNNGFLFQAQGAATDSQANTELSERISCLEQEVSRHKEDAEKAQSEVERLLEILREMENEKNDKEKKINELERWETPCCRAMTNTEEEEDKTGPHHSPLSFNMNR